MQKINKKYLLIAAAVLVIAAVALILVLTGNKGGGAAPEATPAADLGEPEITGVADTSVMAGDEIDLLSGVTAADGQGRDITSSIVITSLPAFTVTDGKATVENAGSYELTFTATDEAGNTAVAYSTLTVTRRTAEAQVFMDMDFADVQADSHGWTAEIGENAQATGELKQGAFVFEIANPGENDGDVRLKKAGMPLQAADYRVRIWIKSSAETYAHVIARNEQAEGWETFGAVWNARIGTAMAPVELNFTSPGEGSAELMINLGRITPNPENPADTTPENFTVTVDKIEIYEITGSQQENPLYTADFADGSAVAISAGDGAAATAEAADGTGTYTITAYPTEGGVWSIKADMPIPGVQLEAGKKYFYRFTVSAENAQGGECLVESAELADRARANFNGLNIPAGETVEISNVFTAENAVSDPVIRMQIGNPSEGAAANTLTVTNLVFGEMTGDLNVAKTTDAFGISTAANPNPDVLYAVYNGTDEDNERGVGTLWTEGGHLFYRIDQGGSVDWHNKLFFGHGAHPLTLPADNYFTIEITAKATRPVSCGFFLNPVGSWDPRVSQTIDFTTEEQTFTFETTQTLITDMDFEMLFQFGSNSLAEGGEVTIEITDIKIMQRSVI